MKQPYVFMIILQVILVTANLVMAAYHASLFKKDKTVKHGWWGALYLAFAGVLSWYNHSWLLFIASLFIRKVIFDLSLNLFRDLPLFYVSKEPQSIIDKLHWKLFGFHSEWYMAIYTLVIIILNFFM